MMTGSAEEVVPADVGTAEPLVPGAPVAVEVATAFAEEPAAEVEPPVEPQAAALPVTNAQHAGARSRGRHRAGLRAGAGGHGGVPSLALCDGVARGRSGQVAVTRLRSSSRGRR